MININLLTCDKETIALYDKHYEEAIFDATFVDFKAIEVEKNVYDINGEIREINIINDLKENFNYKKIVKSERKPLLIVNHYTHRDGGIKDIIDIWEKRPLSSHYVIDKAGNIYCTVDINDVAYANGFTDEFLTDSSGNRIAALDENQWYVSKDPLIDFLKFETHESANYESVSIEHISTDGSISEMQFRATVWLHKYIIATVKKDYGYKIIPDREHIVRHFDITGKDCPKINFPWKEILVELNKST